MSDTLHCPSCGASISSDAPKCAYCRSLLQTVACPSCMGTMFVGNKFCPHCGAAAVKVDASVETSHNCPRCSSMKMKAIPVGRIHLEECTGCGGVWVDSGTFNQICADKEAQSAALNISLPPPPPLDSLVRYLKCPVCADLMNRSNFAHSSAVVIDICKRHGIWFDRDELRRIIEFIRAGGMDRQRLNETQELQRERGRLEAQQRVSAMDNIGAGVLCGPGDGDRTAEDIVSGVSNILWWLIR